MVGAREGRELKMKPICFWSKLILGWFKNQPGLTITCLFGAFFSFMATSVYHRSILISNSVCVQLKDKAVGSGTTAIVTQTFRNATDKAFQRLGAFDIPTPFRHAASPAPSKPPMQTHTLPLLKQPQ